MQSGIYLDNKVETVWRVAMALGDDVIDGVKEITDTVTRAVNTGDFSHLSSDIKRTTERFTSYYRHNPNNTPVVRTQGRVNEFEYKRQQREQARLEYYNRTQQYTEMRRRTSAFYKRNVGSTIGIGSVIFGGIGTGINSISALGTFFGTLFLPNPATITLTAIFSALTFASLMLLRNGLKQRKLVAEYRVFKRIAGNSEFITLSEFARNVNLTTEKLKEELKKMMGQGMLPGASFDDQETTLLLTDNAYSQYIAMQDARIQRENQIRANQIDVSNMSEDSEAQKILNEGNQYISFIHSVNDKIAVSDPMTDKLNKLEEIMHIIFEQVRNHPEKATELRKFMNYYLPTTKKLLNSYMSLDDASQRVANAAESRAQISEAIDMINKGFEALLNDLMQDQAWDISSDISVMETMFRQDGLVKEENK